MVVQEQTLYVIATVVALVATVVTAVQLRKNERNARRHIGVMVLLLAVLGAGYGTMALGKDGILSLDLLVLSTPDGEPVYLSRFAVYTITYTFVMSYVGLIAGASLRYRLIPGIATLAFVYGTVVVQMAPAPIDSVGTLVVLVSLITVLWAFFGPLTRAAKAVSGNRQLLFVKLRNLGALIFISYLLLALMTRQALGLFDAFVGVFLAAYLDLLAHLGLIGIIVYSRETIGELAANYRSPLATFKARTEQTAEVGGDEQPADD
jgi:bacteriorhodopsin